MSEFKLADTMEVAVEEAARIIKDFFSRVPYVEKTLNMFGNLAKSRGFIRSSKPYGRIRFFDDYQSNDFRKLGEIERAGKNMPIQSTNADMTKLAMVYVYRHIKKFNLPIKIVMVVYDEIQTECLKEISHKWEPVMTKLMIDAAKVILKRVPMKVDCKAADHWAK